MSIFTPIEVACPACGEPVPFRAVASVNADRAPELRAQILDRTFQKESCSHCGEVFRLEPRLSYFDMDRGQWILAKPAGDGLRWSELESEATRTFNLAYGPKASAMAQAIGAAMTVRIAFGWSGLREKLLCADRALDDVALESLKVALVAGVDASALSDQTELRLVGVEQDTMVLAWIQPASEAMHQVVRVPRAAYDAIVAAPADWAELRAALTAGPYVDVNRVLIPTD